MNIDKWLEEHSSEITLFGTKGIEVVKTEDVRELFKSLQEELNSVSPIQSTTDSCDSFKLEEGMFAYIPDGVITEEFLDVSRKCRDYNVERYLLDSCREGICWKYVVYAEGIVSVGDEDHLKTFTDAGSKEIPYDKFLQAMKKEIV